VPVDFLEENWHANGNVEIMSYKNNDAAFNRSSGLFGFHKPVSDDKARELRHAYFAATSFIDVQIGKVMDALDEYGFANNTVVALWSDHGYVLLRQIFMPYSIPLNEIVRPHDVDGIWVTPIVGAR